MLGNPPVHKKVSINKLFEFIFDKYTPEKAVEIYKILMDLKERPRKLDQIAYHTYKNDEVQNAIQICCEWLSKIEKEYTYFYPFSIEKIYDVLHFNFKKSGLVDLEKFEPITTFENTLNMLNDFEVVIVN